MAHVVDTADGPVTPVPLEIAVEAATGLRCAVTGVGPPGCEQVVVVVEQEGKAGLADAGRRRRPFARRSPRSRSPPCSPCRSCRSTAVTTRRSTAPGSAAGRRPSSPAGRRRGGSDAGARHRRLRPARADDDRGARRARPRGRGAAAAAERASSTCEQVLADVCDRDGRRRRRGGLRRRRPRRRPRRRRRQPRGVPPRQRRRHRVRRRGLPRGRRAAARRRLLAVGRLRVGADGRRRRGGADHGQARPLLVLGVEGRGGARWRWPRTTPRSR